MCFCICCFCDPIEFWSKTSTRYWIYNVFFTIFAIFGLVLTSLQMENDSDGFFSCGGVFKYVSPLKFKLTGGDKIVCSWPIPNSVFRLVANVLLIFMPILYVEATEHKKWMDTYVKYNAARSFIVVMAGCFFSAFVLDSDHTRLGYEYCEDTLKDLDIAKTCYVDIWMGMIALDMAIFVSLVFFYLLFQKVGGDYINNLTKKRNDYIHNRTSTTNNNNSNVTTNTTNTHTIVTNRNSNVNTTNNYTIQQQQQTTQNTNEMPAYGNFETFDNNNDNHKNTVSIGDFDDPFNTKAIEEPVVEKQVTNPFEIN